MRKTVFITLVWLCFVPLLSLGKNYRPQDVPMVHLKDRMRYVSDPEHILQPQTIADIDRSLAELENQTGIQVVVSVVPAIDGGDCFDFAYQLGDTNGVGEAKRDNGLVVVLSIHDRCIQFATGYGLEGFLPDAICKRIQVRYMNPYFKNNQWDEGLSAGMKALKGYLDGSMKRDINNEDNESTSSLFTLLLFLGLAFIVYFILVSRKRTKCPHCNRHGLILVSDQITLRTSDYIHHLKTYRCKYCGTEKTEMEKEEQDDFRGPMGGGPFMGGFGRGSFSGGSFGGGSFGGGGAGSRF